MVIKIIKKGDGSVVKIPVKKVDAVIPVGEKVVKKRPLTIREERAVSEVAKGSKKAVALRRAGFPESTARQPSKVFNRPVVKAALDPIINKLISHRNKVIARMEKTIDKAGYAVLSMSLGQLNRDIELLSGKPTERQETVVSDEDKAKYKELLGLNS